MLAVMSVHNRNYYNYSFKKVVVEIIVLELCVFDSISILNI